MPLAGPRPRRESEGKTDSERQRTLLMGAESRGFDDQPDSV
jgi:hypothetical protein